jgi:quercetin dioxygenase-like cupin family protein
MPETLAHHFVGDDVYLKEFTLEDNESVQQHNHALDHVTILTEGCIIMDKAGERTVHWSPAFIMVEKGISHGFTAVNGKAKGYCTHICKERDIDLIDTVLTH